MKPEFITTQPAGTIYRQPDRNSSAGARPAGVRYRAPAQPDGWMREPGRDGTSQNRCKTFRELPCVSWSRDRRNAA